ncbi:glycine zipper 2TM domain-containing protein [Dyella sp. A6]|uniref:glycine zipper 2TM domain-containing protein n=1 Tax=Dyella aluminiiresistens TaxID=3069105 RepID=UPI002E7692B0|nr:glycine zipper 2TM domain-containing protein [Dyella sp. A6]
MNRLVVNALHVGIAASLALGLAACNRSASADAGAGAAAPAAAPGPTAAAPAAAPQSSGPQYAKVVSVTPINKTVTTPGQVCKDVVVNHTQPPKDQHHIAGTAIGAVAGGLLGHFIGGGRGKTLATVAGAAAGGYAGNRIEAAHQHGTVTSTVERQCSTVNNTKTTTVGYNVKYVYDGVTRTTRMDHDPGDRVEVQQGVIAVSSAH